jgi:spore maturation protein CgeB
VGDALARIVLAQIDEFRPDVVYVQDFSVLAPSTLRRIRRRGALLVGQIATELPPDRSVRCFDLIICSFPHYVERLARRGTDC